MNAALKVDLSRAVPDRKASRIILDFVPSDVSEMSQNRRDLNARWKRGRGLSGDRRWCLE
jgi:hypothetical protein